VATKDEHLAKAGHNEKFVAAIVDPFWDWAITGIFYAALHYLMAFLATKGDHPGTHQVRNSHIHRDATLKPIYVDYRELQNESEDARYMERNPATAFTEADVKRLTVNLRNIKNLVTPLL